MEETKEEGRTYSDKQNKNEQEVDISNHKNLNFSVYVCMWGCL